MTNIFTQLKNDENGFIVSAELVLVATIGVLSMVVGLSEVALNVNTELEDVGTAFACIQQSYKVQGINGHKACFSGSRFHDHADFCSGENDIR